MQRSGIIIIAFLMLTGFKSPVEEEIYYDSIEYLAQCVQAEAGNQSDYGKRLVCDVIINRFNAGGYDNYYDVIDEKNQFSCVSDKRIYDMEPTEKTYRIVNEELKSRIDDKVWYFRTDKYHTYGSPMFKVGDHYFNSK